MNSNKLHALHKTDHNAYIELTSSIGAIAGSFGSLFDWAGEDIFTKAEMNQLIRMSDMMRKYSAGVEKAEDRIYERGHDPSYTHEENVANDTHQHEQRLYESMLADVEAHRAQCASTLADVAAHMAETK